MYRHIGASVRSERGEYGSKVFLSGLFQILSVCAPFEAFGDAAGAAWGEAQALGQEGELCLNALFYGCLREYQSEVAKLTKRCTKWLTGLGAAKTGG